MWRSRVCTPEDPSPSTPRGAWKPLPEAGVQGRLSRISQLSTAQKLIIIIMVTIIESPYLLYSAFWFSKHTHTL